MSLLAKLVSLNIARTINAGQPLPVQVTLTNIGTETWLASTPASGMTLKRIWASGENPFFLGTQGKNWPGGEKRQPVPMDVAPGQNVTFSWTENAPSIPGTYTFDWSMVRERVAWFGDHAAADVVVNQGTGGPAADFDFLIPAPNYDAQDLIGFELFNTGPTLMDSKLHWLRGKNNTNRIIKIRQIDLWMGADLGVVADMNATIFRLRKDGKEEMMIQHAWDHYNNPTTLHHITYSFAPDFVALGIGQILELRHFFGQFNTPNGHGHVLCVARALSK